MASINEILGKNIDSVKALKAEIRSLQDSLVGLDSESQEFRDTTAKLTAAQDELTKVTRAGKEENTAAKDSLVGMRQEYKALYDQYKLLTEEQRNSDFGKNMADSLESLSDKINDTQKGIGDFRGNVGRYTQSITEAFNGMGISVKGLEGPFKAAQVASGGLNKAFKTLAANPLMLAITAIIAILTKAAAAIKQNEELTMRLQQALSVFKPVLDFVSNAFDSLAGILVKVVEGFAKVSEKVLSVIPGMKKAIDSHKELAKATNDLTKAQRENSVVLSQKQSEVEALRAEAAAATDNAEKLQLLEEAKAKQAEIDQTNLELAQEDLRIKEALAEKTANDTQAEEELAAARKKVSEITAQASKNEKEYNKQIKTTTQAINNQTNSTNKSTVVVKNYREEAKKLYEQLVEDSKDEVTKLTEKYEKEKKLLEKYHMDTRLLTQKYERDKKEIVLNTLENTQNERRASYNAQLEQYSKYISQQRELLQDDPVGLATFEKQISTEILERFKKIEDAAIKTQKTLFSLGDGKNTNLLNAFSTVFYDGNVQNISNYSAAIDVLKKKVSEFADYAEGTQGKLMHDIYQNALSALKKMSPKDWVKQTKDIQEQVDSLRTAYGVSIDTMEEATRLTEIQNKNIEKMKKLLAELPAQMAGEEQIKKIQDAIRENYVTELEGLIKTVSYDTFEGYTVFMAEQEAKALEVEKTALEEQLNNFSGTTEQKLEIMKRYYEVLAEMREKDREKDQALNELNQQRTSEMVENLIDAADRMGSALGTWKQTRESVIDSELKAGKISEQEATKQKKRLLTLERLERDFAIATIVADAASGAFSIWKGYATEVGVINAQTAAAAGPGAAVAKAALDAKSLVSAIAKTAGLAATATAQIAAAQGKYVVAKNNMSAESGGGGSVGVAAAPILIDSQPYSYTRTLQTQEEEDAINQRPIWVSVQDISNALDHQVVVSEETSF